MEVQDIINEFIDQRLTKEKIYSLIGTAKNVNETTRLCDVTPVGDEAERLDVRLQAIESGILGIVLVPKENSKVVITFINRTLAFVSLTSELEKILIDTSLVQFNGGLNGGLINITDLVSNMNTIEAKLETLITKFNAHTHITTATVSAGSPGVLAPTTSAETALSQTSVPGDFEDTAVKH